MQIFAVDLKSFFPQYPFVALGSTLISNCTKFYWSNEKQITCKCRFLSTCEFLTSYWATNMIVFFFLCKHPPSIFHNGFSFCTVTSSGWGFSTWWIFVDICCFYVPDIPVFPKSYVITPHCCYLHFPKGK